jgi:glycine/D-amino acid oxidase-like deaminating enzyme
MEHIWPRLAECSSLFERRKHVRGWSGLYAVTPDRSGIAGPVRGLTNFFEAHSFTGRGVMQSYGVARALAAWIDTGRPQGSIASKGRSYVGMQSTSHAHRSSPARSARGPIWKGVPL